MGIKKLTKISDKETTRSKEEICSKQHHNFLSRLLLSKAILLKLMVSFE